MNAIMKEHLARMEEFVLMESVTVLKNGLDQLVREVNRKEVLRYSKTKR